MTVKLQKNTSKSGFTQISNIFIDELMPKAAPVFSIVYIYALRQLQGGERELTNSGIAHALDILESDVIRGWKYWSNAGAIKYNEETGAVEILDLSQAPEAAPIVSQVFAERRPTYSPDEISLYINKNKEVRELFASAGSHLGRLLSQSDMATIFSFHDWLRLPFDVIEVLLAYCAQNGHLSMRYIEKTAITWAEEGINTSEKAFERIKLFNVTYRQIMKAFGQGSRSPIQSEMQAMKKWLDEYKTPMELILYACEKSVATTGNASFKYADAILTNWNAKGVKTMEAVKADEADFAAGKKGKQAFGQALRYDSKPTQKPKNRFINYTQRDWDFDEIERLKYKGLEKNLEE